MEKPKLIAGLDLGSRQFVAAAGIAHDRERLVVQAVESIPSQGFQRGVLSDPIECADTIGRLTRQLERVLGSKIGRVQVAIHGNYLKSYNTSASIPVPDPTVGISRKDLEKAITTCRDLSLEYDRKMIHTFERGFAVDGQTGIQDPVGLYGTKLSVDLHLVTALAVAVQNLTRVLHRAGLEPEEFILPALAVSEGVLSDFEKDLGVCLIRIGQTQTEVVLFNDGQPRQTLLIPWGMEPLADALGRSLKLPRPAVDQLLEQVQSLEGSPEEASVPLRVKAGSLIRTIEQGQTVQMIGSRLKEFFGRVQKQLDESPYFRESSAGIVMVGNLTRLDGFLEMAEGSLNMPVRLGTIREIEMNPSVNLTSSHATAVGLLRYGAKRHRDSFDGIQGPLWWRWLEKTRRTLEEYF